MELVFRKLPPAESLDPQPGEVYLLPAAKEHRQRRDLAKFVLEQGADALLQGPGAPERLVLDADPKFDDMLASLFAYQRFQGRTVPAGCKAFAEYAAQLREGLRPTALPLTDSIEGIYLAIRGSAEKSLTDPETAKHFLSDWGRLAATLLKAAEQNKDPFTASLFDPLADYMGERRTVPLKSINRAKSSVAAGVGFLREQAFLVKDLEVYRQDFLRGERWQVRLPGGPPSAPALLLRRPKSLLFKYWTRSPCPPPLDGPYLFLAVTAAEGQWIFSTEPKQKISLQPLAEVLQAAERKQTPGRADQDPWFDGKSMQHAVVASPRHGTRLSESAVLGIVKKWSRAKSVGQSNKMMRLALVICCLAAGLIAAVLFANPFGEKKEGKGNDAPKVTQATDYHDLFV
ncbi:MAG TPA: hypothetical protein VE988_01515, partial [Gemmataceae bacterium]|nr:hypothetical protein [Gemmataceae bacterium]